MLGTVKSYCKATLIKVRYSRSWKRGAVGGFGRGDVRVASGSTVGTGVSCVPHTTLHHGLMTLMKSNYNTHRARLRYVAYLLHREAFHPRARTEA